MTTTTRTTEQTIIETLTARGGYASLADMADTTGLPLSWLHSGVIKLWQGRQVSLSSLESADDRLYRAAIRHNGECLAYVSIRNA